jgi:pimeloyl-ACP methyl ester carboxylesterase
MLITGGLTGWALAEDVDTLTLEEIRAKYELPASRYVDIDGVDLHYVDEGAGRTVLLLHASWMNLHSWEGIASRLKENYRVIRFDFPTAGLSGFETVPAPADRFHLIERNVDILSRFVKTLDLDEFYLVGTSSGGSVAFRFASRNPERVKRLVLINSAGMPRTAQTDPNRARPEFQNWADMPVKPREFWAYGFSLNFLSPDGPPDWLIDQAYDFERREGLAETRAANYRFGTGDPQSILAEIRAPTLIMWGLNNPTVMHLEADVMQHWMTGAPTLVRKYAGRGHYPYMEDATTIYRDLSAFLAGQLDGELRRTAMLKPDSGYFED